MIRAVTFSLSVLCLLCVGLAVADATTSPTALLRERDKSVRAYLKQNPPPLNAKQRGYLEDQLNELFDYKTIAIESLGRNKSKATPQQLDEYIDVFGRVTRQGTTEDEALDTFLQGTIRYESEELDENGNTLVTTVIEKNDEEIVVEYIFTKKNGQWKIVDYILDDVGLVENYRSSFGKIIKESGFAELIKKLKDKLKKKG